MDCNVVQRKNSRLRWINWKKLGFCHVKRKNVVIIKKVYTCIFVFEVIIVGASEASNILLFRNITKMFIWGH